LASAATYAFTFSNKAAVANIVGIQQTLAHPEYAKLYDEYRVLGVEVTVGPTNVDSSTGALGPNITCTGTFRAAQDPAALPATLSDAAQYDDLQFSPTTMPVHRTIKMSGADEAAWQTTDAVLLLDDTYTGVFFHNIYSLTTQTFDFAVKWRVQYRSTKSLSLTRVAPARPATSELDELLEELTQLRVGGPTARALRQRGS
jgi:hypothetical protein